MALIVQSYPPVDGANGYVSVAEFKAYCDARLMDYSTGGKVDADIEVAIIRASQHADLRFDYRDEPASADQETELPRVGGSIPKLFKQGVIEYAFRALRMVLWADPAQDTTGAAVKRRLEEVGPIKEEVEYDNSVAVSGLPEYPVADRLIQKSGVVKPDVDVSGGLTVVQTARGS